MDEVYAYLEKKEYPANATAAQNLLFDVEPKIFRLVRGLSTTLMEEQ